MIAILVALREEEKAVERSLGRIEAATDERITIARSGVGKERAARCASSLIGVERPRLLIVAGFGGAARDGLTAGRVIVASEVVEEGGGAWVAPRALVEAGLRAGGALALEGRLATVDRVLSGEAEKRGAGEALRADAVDMESSGAVRAATASGVPVLCVRAIFDEVGFEIPFDLHRMLTPGGRVRPFGALREIASHPRGLLRLPALRARAREAALSLGKVVAALVRETKGLT